MRKGTPGQLIAELTDRIAQLKDEEINSSSVIIDEEDMITADEDIDPIEIEEIDDVDVEEPEETDTSAYLDKLYENVETELEESITDVSWSSDESNIYMDANFVDGHILTFTIPKADLAFDLNGIDKDVEYICVAVRDSQETQEDIIEDIPEEDENYNMEDYYDPDEVPPYL